MLFATLDPTLRAVQLPGGMKIILSDTVGFISDLPTMLVAAFRATLEEVIEADVILHVRDVSHEDAEAQSHDVEEVLDARSASIRTKSSASSRCGTRSTGSTPTAARGCKISPSAGPPISGRCWCRR